MTTPLRLSVIELAREHRTKVTEFLNQLTTECNIEVHTPESLEY